MSLTAPHRHSSSLDFLSSFVCQENKDRLFVFFLLNNGLSLFFELLDILPDSQKKIRMNCVTHHRGSFKHSVGTEGFDKANSRKLM